MSVALQSSAKLVITIAIVKIIISLSIRRKVRQTEITAIQNSSTHQKKIGTALYLSGVGVDYFDLSDSDPCRTASEIYDRIALFEARTLTNDIGDKSGLHSAFILQVLHINHFPRQLLTAGP